MIEGIYYYPKQKKQKAKRLIWILLLAGIIAILFWYFSNETNANKLQPFLIKVTDTAIKPINIKTIPAHKTQQSTAAKFKVVENLDEVIHTYNAKK